MMLFQKENTLEMLAWMSRIYIMWLVNEGTLMHLYYCFSHLSNMIIICAYTLRMNMGKNFLYPSWWAKPTRLFWIMSVYMYINCVCAHHNA